jgi:hypothetical protein
VDESEVSSSAATLGRLGGSKGGKARAAQLSPEQRSAAARAAAEARWGKSVAVETPAAVEARLAKSVAVATHEGELVVGDKHFDCAVLDDGTRVLSQGTVLAALGRAPTRGRDELRRGGLPPFLTASNLKPYISDELLENYEPVQYRRPGGSARSLGYKAEMLPMVCEVYLDAKHDDILHHTQVGTAAAAELLIRGLARVGIIALVDEATGYQEVRARQELQKILEAYVRAEFRPWVRTFPHDFFREIYRLHGWEFRPGTTRRTPHVGKLIKHYIYEQLPSGVLEELERVNPKNNKGNRPRKHHQHLTSSTGNIHLDKQITGVMTLMRAARNRREFDELFERVFPPAQMKLPLEIDFGGKEG